MERNPFRPVSETLRAMKTRFLAAALALLTAMSNLLAGPRDDQWKSVNEAADEGLPKTAIERLEPIIQGALADKVGVHYSFIVGVLCFAYLAFYAVAAARTLRRQGIDLDKLAAEGGH